MYCRNAIVCLHSFPSAKYKESMISTKVSKSISTANRRKSDALNVLVLRLLKLLKLMGWIKQIVWQRVLERQVK